jgi:hypothetical protein
LREVLDRLRTYKLKLQPDKWEVPQRGSKLFGSPNNRGRGKARPPECSRYHELHDAHLSDGAENILWDKLLSQVYT